MKTIKIDEEVYAFIQKKAIAFVEQPNDTLKRLLKISKKNHNSSYKEIIQKKKPRAELSILINVGMLEDNQKLYLYDGRHKKVKEGIATVKRNHNKILYNGKLYSMCDLALKILQKHGYKGPLRGPKFWKIENGTSIVELWDRYLETMK